MNIFSRASIISRAQPADFMEHSLRHHNFYRLRSLSIVEHGQSFLIVNKTSTFFNALTWGDRRAEIRALVQSANADRARVIATLETAVGQSERVERIRDLHRSAAFLPGCRCRSLDGGGRPIARNSAIALSANGASSTAGDAVNGSTSRVCLFEIPSGRAMFFVGGVWVPAPRTASLE